MRGTHPKCAQWPGIGPATGSDMATSESMQPWTYGAPYRAVGFVLFRTHACRILDVCRHTHPCLGRLVSVRRSQLPLSELGAGKVEKSWALCNRR